jgi:hypothetical protein
MMIEECKIFKSNTVVVIIMLNDNTWEQNAYINTQKLYGIYAG